MTTLGAMTCKKSFQSTKDVKITSTKSEEYSGCLRAVNCFFSRKKYKQKQQQHKSIEVAPLCAGAWSSSRGQFIVFFSSEHDIFLIL
jgi:hypothetical protein